MPLVLGGLSFMTVVVLEGIASLVRAKKVVTPVTPPPPVARAASGSGMDAEVEALLNQILAQTQAEGLTQTPPQAGDAESSGTGGPRNLSTTH